MKKQMIYFFLFFTGLSFGQDLNSYAPVSPTAASLGKFGVFPVNTNLGTTAVSIPLYTIKQGDIEIPIGLSYNASSGIRVNEEASWVGLGWTLNAGGAIVRNVKGQPGTADIPDLGDLDYTLANYNYMLDVAKGHDDDEQDEYLFNYSGVSGSFYYNQEQSRFVFKDYKPVQIIASGTGDYKFEALLENGIHLNFDAHERVNKWQDHQLPIRYREYRTASFISQITSSNKVDTVTFQYDDLTIEKEPEVIGDQVVVSSRTPVTPGPPTPMRTKGYTSYEKTLKRINFKNGYVLFDYSLDRTDSDSPKLNHIKVYATSNGIDSLIKQITFSYSDKGRLMLDKVTLNAQGPEPAIYQLTYNSQRLPARNSVEQDFWGYANTNTGSYTHKRDATFHLVKTEGNWLWEHQVDSYNATVGTGDRSANEEKMKAGILTKIHYPTGGYTEFEYEANKYTEHVSVPVYKSGGDDVFSQGAGGSTCKVTGKDTKTFAPSNASLRTKIEGTITIYFSQALKGNGNESYVTFNGKTYKRKAPGDLPYYPYTEYTEDITVYKGESYTLEAWEHGEGSNMASGCAEVSAYVNWQELTGYTTKPIEKYVGGLRIKSITNYDGISSGYSTKKEFEYGTPRQLIPINHEDYQTLKWDGGFTNIVTSSPSYALNINGGPAVEYTKVTEYNYDRDRNDNGKIVYEYERTPSDRIIGTGAGGGSHFKMFMHPGYYGGTCGGLQIPHNESSVLYTVRTKGYGNFSNYYTKSWASGSLKKQTYYKRNTDQSYTKVKDVEHTYSQRDETKVTKHYIYEIWPWASQTQPFSIESPCNNYNGTFMYNKGFLSFGKKLLTATKETTYDTNGAHPVVLEKSYSYNHPNYFPTESKVTSSDNTEVKTKTFYPNSRDHLSGLSLDDKNAYYKLEQLHRIATPIQTESYRGNSLLATQRTLYRPGTVANSYFPKSIQAAKGRLSSVNSLTDRIQYHQYDGNGNPIEVSKADGSHIVYIWGYQGQHPIAKIENTTYTEVSPHIAGLQAKSNADTDHCRASNCKEQQLRDALQNLRTALPNAMVSTYTYDPLIGVTSMTDPKGYTTYYEYDGLSRLKHIRDADTNITNKYYYNYAGEPIAPLTFTIGTTKNWGYVNDEITLQSIIDGGSGRFSYAWKISKPGNQLVESTNKDLTFQSGATKGMISITLTIKDLVTHKTKTASKSISLYQPLTVSSSSISRPEKHLINTSAAFNINPTEGSGNYSYDWEVRGRGMTHKTTQKSFNLMMGCKYYGQVTVKCTVKDNITKAIKTVTTTMNVSTSSPMKVSLATMPPTSSPPRTQKFKVLAKIRGGTGSYTYRWYLNGSKISSSSTIDITLRCGGTSKSATVTCTVIDNCTGITASTFPEIYKYTISSARCNSGSGGGGPNIGNPTDDSDNYKQ